MTTPSATAYVQNLLDNVGDQRFCNINWNDPNHDAIWVRKGLDPTDVRREAGEMKTAIAAYRDAH